MGRTYEHYSSDIDPKLSVDILASDFVLLDKSEAHRSLALPLTGIYKLRSHREADRILTDLATTFLRRGNWVQYTSCTRHPIELLTAVKSWFDVHKSEDGWDWEKQSKRIVAVDACTPNFGYTDSIYEVRTLEATKMCLKVIKSQPSFAGIHTAAARAFNLIKENSSGTREPTLVVYEGLHALVDLESSEQYRVFFSHVLPSERLWGGMFTIVIEFSPGDENIRHIRTYGDYFYASEETAGPQTAD